MSGWVTNIIVNGLHTDRGCLCIATAVDKSHKYSLTSEVHTPTHTHKHIHVYTLLLALTLVYTHIHVDLHVVYNYSPQIYIYALPPSCALNWTTKRVGVSSGSYGI